MPEDLSSPCPLCASINVSVEESLSGTKLRKLWATVGHQLSQTALGTITDDSKVNLHQCRDCGFRFFDPRLAGSGEFYEELMSGRSYPTTSPEFQAGINVARENGVRRILDVGGGEGAFLDLAKQAGFETMGIELNRDASRLAAEKGHKMFDRAMEEMTLEELGGGADLLTLFQVVEHVPAPVDFVRSAARLVKPGGFLLVAVPSSKRMLGLLHHDPLDWPPHHISRWREKDLSLLGEQSGLAVVRTGADPMLGTSIPWAASLHKTLEEAIGNQPKYLPTGPIRLASLLYRSLRMKHYLPFHGLSIHGIYRKSI